MSVKNSSESNDPGGQSSGSTESTGHNDGTGGNTPDDDGSGAGSSGDEKPPEGNQNPGDPDSSKWDESTRNYIKKLRGEAASNRKKASSLEERLNAIEKGLKKVVGGEEDDDLTPEDRAQALEAYAGQKDFETEVLRLALDNGIGKDKLEYFEFLIAKAAGSLGEDEELDEEAIAGLVKKVKSSGDPSGTSTSITPSGEGGDTPPPDKSGDVNLDKFCNMSMVQKSKLFESNRALYDKLMSEAKQARRLV